MSVEQRVQIYFFDVLWNVMMVNVGLVMIRFWLDFLMVLEFFFGCVIERLEEYVVQVFDKVKELGVGWISKLVSVIGFW